MIVNTFLCKNSNTGEVHECKFLWRHYSEAAIETGGKYELPDRNAALELVNKWNRISQGTYIYWID